VISKKFYIPDFRYLLLAPEPALEMLDIWESEVRSATQSFLDNSAYRTLYKDGITDADILANVSACFNFPPSQFQLHMQWIVPPMMPFHHRLTCDKHHYTKFRCFPLSYVRKILRLGRYPHGIAKDTSIESIVEHYTTLGIDYEKEWEEWFVKICIGATERMQNWKPDDFQYVVEDGKAFNFSIEDGHVKLGARNDTDPGRIQAADKIALQNYGRPYNEAGKPTGTYIQQPLKPQYGEGGYTLWPPTDVSKVH
jgi:hypothetical protein